MEKNNTPATWKPQPLPTVADLHHDPATAFKNNVLLSLLNQPPHVDWLKDFPPEMKIKGKYMPIGRVTFLLTYIFQEWYPEVISYSQMFQSVCCHVRLHYRNPVTGVWEFKDGVGASGIQLDKGSNAADLSAIKFNAVQIALPKAKTAAIKDAADELGSLFAGDVNRKDQIAFSPSYMPAAEPGNGNGNAQKKTETKLPGHQELQKKIYDEDHSGTNGKTFAVVPEPEKKQTAPAPAPTPTFNFNTYDL